MGFYSPAVLIKDAQRHGLRVLPVDVNRSDWDCTIEVRDLRLGLRSVRGLRAEAGRRIAAARPYHTVDDLARRVPEIRKNEMEALAGIGALNSLEASHRRDALWKAGRASRPIGPLLEEVPETQPQSPLFPMSTDERLEADYRGTGLTIGPHPMHYRRTGMNSLGVTPARDLEKVPHGGLVRIAGSVIVRQRPGTAKGIVFLSIEDETGIANAVVMPDTFESFRLTLVTEPYLLIEGKVQNVEGVIHVLARRIEALRVETGTAPSHDFH
jgi:error-prone DNA polymerase